MQLLAPAAVQVEHDRSHATQEPPDSYLPSGQALTHAPLSISGVPLEGQLVQSVLPEPEHCWHVEWHAVHRLTEPWTSTKVPSTGQLAIHEPLCKKGVELLVQLRHSELDGPVHVPHVESQAWQT